MNPYLKISLFLVAFICGCSKEEQLVPYETIKTMTVDELCSRRQTCPLSANNQETISSCKSKVGIDKAEILLSRVPDFVSEDRVRQLEYCFEQSRKFINDCNDEFQYEKGGGYWGRLVDCVHDMSKDIQLNKDRKL